MYILYIAISSINFQSSAQQPPRGLCSQMSYAPIFQSNISLAKHTTKVCYSTFFFRILQPFDLEMVLVFPVLDNQLLNYIIEAQSCFSAIYLVLLRWKTIQILVRNRLEAANSRKDQNWFFLRAMSIYKLPDEVQTITLVIHPSILIEQRKEK